jgi:hypothetical protein
MSVPEMQARVRARVWQSIAQSGVELSALPQADLDRLVASISEGVLQELDTVIGEVDTRQNPVVATIAEEVPEGEQVLWQGRPFLSLSTHYQITNERIRIVEGLLGKSWDDIELVRIQDIDKTQSAGERMLNIGDIHIRGGDRSTPEVTLRNVPNPLEVHEILRRAVLEARQKHGLRFREEM